MKTSSMMTSAMPSAPVGKAWEEVSGSFDRFCLAAGIETLGKMMEADTEVACGPRHSRSEDRRGHRWGRTAGKIGFHAGKIAIERPRAFVERDALDEAGEHLAAQIRACVLTARWRSS